MTPRSNLPTKTHLIAWSRERVAKYFGVPVGKVFDVRNKSQRAICAYIIHHELKAYGFRPTLTHTSDLIGVEIKALTKMLATVDAALLGGDDFESRAIRVFVGELLN